MSGPSDYYVVIPLPLLDAPNAALKVYAILRSYLNPAEPERNEVWPSRKTLAAKAGFSLDTVDRAVDWLVTNGWLVVEQRRDPEGDLTSNRYIVFGAQRLPEGGSRTGAQRGSRTGAATVAANEGYEVEPDEVEPSLPGAVTQFALIAPPSNRRTDDEHFDDFWATYPKRVGKAAARKSWDRAVKKAGPTHIIAAVVAQTDSTWKGKDRQYIPNPATWLNQERWEDDLQQPSSRQNSEADDISGYFND